MRIADKLSEVAEKAIAAKRAEQIRDAAAIRVRELEKAKLKKKKAQETKLAKEAAERNFAFLNSIGSSILEAAWRGEKKLVKPVLADWQKNLLIQHKYKVEDNSKTMAKVAELLEETLPQSVDKLLLVSKSACQKFTPIEENLTKLLSSNWRELNYNELNHWLTSIFNIFKKTLSAYAEIARVREADKYSYHGLMNRLRPAYRFIKENIDSIDTIYEEKLSEKSLLGYPQDGERPFHEIYQKQVIIRRILTQESGFTWEALTDLEIRMLFAAVRNDSSIESAASEILSNANIRFTDSSSIELLSNFDTENSRIVAFKAVHDQVVKQESEIYKCLSTMSELAEAIGEHDDPVLKFTSIQHYYITPTAKFDNIVLYNFLVGKEFENFKQDLTNQMLRAAESGLKTIALKAKEYANGIDVWSAGKRKIFLPMSLDMFLDFNHSDGLGYEVYEKENFNWLIDLAWN